MKMTKKEEKRLIKNTKLATVQEILKVKNVDLWWLLKVNTVDWYNGYRRHKLINKKLTEEEFKILREWIKR